MSKTPEIHLFILWQNALHKKNQIEDDLFNSFELLEIYEVTWPREDFSKELSRFYGENLPKNSHKERHCGVGPFLCYVIRDNSPDYQLRMTSKGQRLVNANIFDKKALFRKWTNHPHLIHATDNLDETRVQLFLIAGKSIDSFDNKKTSIEKPIIEKVGGFHVNSLTSFFESLNATVNYVVLRNFDSLESELSAEHPDIDLLSDDPGTLVRVLGAEKKYKNKNSVQHFIQIDGKTVSIDVRYPGDNYYCLVWERDILLSREKYQDIFVPSKLNHFYSLLYHALLHKKELSSDYVKALRLYAHELRLLDFHDCLVEKNMLKSLICFMDGKNYDLVEPKDLSVFWNISLINSLIDFKVSCSRKLMIWKNLMKLKMRYRVKKTLGLDVKKYKMR